MNAKKKAEPFDLLADSFAQELIEMSDDDVLEGTTAGKSKASGLELLKAAKAAAGKRRLAAARNGVAAAHKSVSTVQPEVSLDDIRAYLKRASNDGRYTMAARGLEEMTESDLRRIYTQLKRLESSRGSNGDDGR